MDAQQYLFRYMSFKRFEEMTHSNTISAFNPAHWPDQYELFWKQKMKSPEGKQQLSNYLMGKVPDRDAIWYEKNTVALLNLLYERICAICFSKTGDKEEMWRANSHNNSSVMIQTNVEKVRYLQKYNDNVSLVLKEIKYVDDEEYNAEYFLNKISFPIYKSIGIEDIENLFLIKRKKFQYEDEARLLVKQMDLNDIKNPHLLIVPDMSSFIDGVMVHPLMDSSRLETVRILCDYYEIPFLGKSEIYKIK